MFYDVKILDANGNVKRVISSESLSRKFWYRNEEVQDNNGNRMVVDFEELDEDTGFNQTVSSKNSNFEMDESVS